MKKLQGQYSREKHSKSMASSRTTRPQNQRAICHKEVGGR